MTIPLVLQTVKPFQLKANFKRTGNNEVALVIKIRVNKDAYIPDIIA